MKVGVIGLGLIGGSIFKDLKRLGIEVSAVSQSQCGENIYKDYTVLKDCGIIFVCSAMNKTLAILDELEKFVKSETIVTDVCSLKGFVSKKERPYRFIPSHPMAGTENKGYESSMEGLFKGAKWVLTPKTKFSESTGYLLPEGTKELIDLIEKLGAIPIITTPEEHDRAAAMISHMPMVLAQALFLSVKDNPLALDMAASGFRDMTRLALSNEEMACDMVTMNSENIQNALLHLYKAVGDLTAGDYPKTITSIKAERSKMFTASN